MLRRRMTITLLSGALLGLICILGALIRSGFYAEGYYLLAFWYNRLLLGFVIGLLSGEIPVSRLMLRGALIGLLVSFAFYSSTGFEDFVGFAAGVIYGVLIEYAAYKFAGMKK